MFSLDWNDIVVTWGTTYLLNDLSFNQRAETFLRHHIIDKILWQYTWIVLVVCRSYSAPSSSDMFPRFHIKSSNALLEHCWMRIPWTWTCQSLRSFFPSNLAFKTFVRRTWHSRPSRGRWHDDQSTKLGSNNLLELRVIEWSSIEFPQNRNNKKEMKKKSTSA